MKDDGSQIWFSEHIFKATVMHLNLEALGVEDHASGLHVELYRCTVLRLLDSTFILGD